MVRRVAACHTFSFIVFSTWLDRLVNAALRFGVQSDSSTNGSFYSSSMFFDSEIERLHITGTAYDDAGRRSCFMGSLQLPELSDDRGPTWVTKKYFGSTNSSLTCSSLFMAKYQGIRTYFLLGYSETFPDFLPINFDQESANRQDVYGVTMELNYAAELYGGSVDQSDRVQYPLSVIGNSSDGQGLFVATAHASTPLSGSSYQKYLDGQHLLQPDPDVTGAFLPPLFEKGCSVTISSLVQTQLNESTVQVSMNNSSSAEEYSNLQKTWTKELRTREGESVFLAGMVKHPLGELLVAGYTAGTGPDFGSSTRDGSIDSFVTSLNPTTGSTLRSMRLQSVSNSTDIILGVCAAELNSSTFYVVGMTNEQIMEAKKSNSSSPGTFKSFVLKLDLLSFSLMWSTEIEGILAPTGGRGNAMATSCAVTKDNAVVYVGGTVASGASVSLDGQTAVTNSSGGDDIFVAKLRVDNGTVVFMRQIGTENDDRIAFGNSLMTDNKGNALVLGNTRGSMFRMKTNDTGDDQSDFVVFSVDRYTGSYIEMAASLFKATNATSNMTVQFNQTDPIESHEETYPTNFTTATPGPSPTTTFHHSTVAPTIVHASNHTKMNNTSGNTTTKKQTSGSSVENGKRNSTSLPGNSSSGGQGQEDTPPKDDTILIASIAMLFVVIAFSCASLSFLRYKRKQDKKVTSTIWNAENGDPSGQPHGHYDGKYDMERAPSSGDRIRYRESHRIDCFDNRSHVSGETLRSSPNPIRIDPETLLRLDPSIFGGSLDDDEIESYVSHQRVSDHYHPSVSLDSVQRSQNRVSTVKSSGGSCLSSGRTSQSRSQKSIRFSDVSIQSESETSFSDDSDELPDETVGENPSEYHTFFDDSTIGSTFLQGDGDDDVDAMSLRTAPEDAQRFSGQALASTGRRGLEAEGDYDGDSAYSGPGVLA